MPVRIQRKRTKGWRMPDNCKYVGRPTKWGNPYKVGGHYISINNINILDPEYRTCKSVEESIELYKNYVKREITCGRLNLEELRGFNLACFCPLSSPCHVDVLIELCTKQKNNETNQKNKNSNT